MHTVFYGEPACRHFVDIIYPFMACQAYRSTYSIPRPRHGSLADPGGHRDFKRFGRQLAGNKQTSMPMMIDQEHKE